MQLIIDLLHLAAIAFPTCCCFTAKHCFVSLGVSRITETTHDARQLLQEGCNKLSTDSATREPGHCQFYIRLPWHNIVQTASNQAQLEGVEIGRQELAQERFLKHKLEKALARKLSEQQAAADKEVAAAMQTASHVTSLQQHIQELKVTMPFLHVCTQCSNIITSHVTHLGHL